MNGFKGITVTAVSSAQDACKGADILITTTPSHEPIVKAEWVSKGAHITAIGSDNPKKRELFTEVLKKADKVVADRMAQCRIAGEIHHALEEKAIEEKNIYAELGEITSGKKPGRESSGEITVFDSTGVAIQDISVTAFVLEKAASKSAGKKIKI